MVQNKVKQQKLFDLEKEEKRDLIEKIVILEYYGNNRILTLSAICKNENEVTLAKNGCLR